MVIRFQILFLTLILTAGNIVGQDDLLDNVITIDKLPAQGTIIDLLEQIERSNGIVFSYSSNQFNANTRANLLDREYTLREALYQVFRGYHVYIAKLSLRKYQLLLSKKTNYNISGIISDSDSGEVMPGAIIYDEYSKEYVVSDESGYYYITVPTGKTSLTVKYLGYNDESIIINSEESVNKNIQIHFLNTIPPITISEKAIDHYLTDPGAEVINSNKVGQNTSILGEKDIYSSLKSSPGIVSGGEGQSGLIIRGGSPDQNLTLLDDVPIYETSHIAGISSIFMDESIRSVNLMKSGIPAEYGGRLSSVVDLQVKDGHSKKQNMSINAGLFGIKFHSEGPIGNNDKFSYILSGRTSWINYFLDALLPSISLYDNLDIGMNDLTTKLAYRISPNSKFTITSYLGNDKISLFKETEPEAGSTFYSKETNQLKWSNAMVSLNFDSYLSKNSKLHINMGYLNYVYKSRGFYDFGDVNENTYIDVISYSAINDRQLKVQYDYYISDAIKLKVGSHIIKHKFSPTVRQSLLKINDEEISLINPDSILHVVENFYFSELNLRIKENLYLYPGVNYSYYSTKEKVFANVQPRLRLAYIPNENIIISVLYTNAVQNIHLLSNPGIGIPSDLWVPSAEDIKPAEVKHLSLDVKKSFGNGWEVSGSWFNKQLSNLIEFDIPTDLFVNILSASTIEPVFTTQNDWKKRIKSGTGHTSGLEFMVRKDKGKVKGWLSLAYIKAERTFTEIDNGQPFPAKYNRPLDINFGLNYEHSAKWSFGANWIYSSGNYFSFPNEVFTSILGLELVRPTGRNNYKLPAFHQLSLSADYKFQMKSADSKLSFGIYNVYNRLNTYFVYGLQNSGSSPKLRQVSIFPLIPHVNFTISL